MLLVIMETNNEMVTALILQMQFDEDRGLLPKGYTENAKKVMGVNDGKL